MANYNDDCFLRALWNFNFFFPTFSPSSNFFAVVVFGEKAEDATCIRWDLFPSFGETGVPLI